MDALPGVLLRVVGEDLVDEGPSCMIMISVKLMYNLLRALLTCHAGAPNTTADFDILQDLLRVSFEKGEALRIMKLLSRAK